MMTRLHTNIDMIVNMDVADNRGMGIYILCICVYAYVWVCVDVYMCVLCLASWFLWLVACFLLIVS